MNWKMFIRMALPMLRMAGEAKRAEGENTSGKDDLIGTVLIFAADLIEWAITDGKALPKVPDALK